MTATLKYRDVPNDAIMLMLFPYSLEGAARICNNPSVCAATGSFNQVSPPNRASHQISPPGFAPVQNNPIRFNQGQGNYFNQANNFNQVNNFKGNNFQNNQGYRAQMNNAPNFQNQSFQNQLFSVPNNQIQSGIPNELSSYMKSKEIMIKSMQNQINVLRGDFNKEEEKLRRNLNDDMRSIFGSFFQHQPLTSGTLPSNTVPNPKGEMKAVTTCSSLAYEGPSIPTSSPLEKVDEQNTEEILEKVHSNCPGSTAQVQPSVMPISIMKPDVSRTQPKPTFPYPSSFVDALLLMPKFTLTIKSLLANKDKLFELAKVLLNENCSAMLLKKLPEKLGDPGKFLIPCDFPGMEVGKFHFPIDFVVIDFEADPRVPLILGRSFLRIGRALIDVYGEEITLKGDILFLEKLLNEDPFQLLPMDLKLAEESKEKSSVEEPPELELKELPSHLEYAFLEDSNKLPIYEIKGIDPRFYTHKILMEDDYKPAIQSQRRINPKIHDVIKKEVIKLLDAGMIYPISNSPWMSPIHCVPKKGGITVVANENNKLIPTRLVTSWRVCIDYRKLNDATRKVHFLLPFMDQMLKRLVGNEFYCFLDGFSGYFQIPIDPQDQEKTTFTCPYGTFVYRRMPFGLCNAPGHKISKSGIEVDRAKVDVIAKLPHPTTVKGVRSFLGHAGFYCRFIQDFSKIARPLTHLLEKETPFVFSKECIDAFNTLKKKLTEAPILVVPDWNLPFKLMCDASDYTIGAVLGQRNDRGIYFCNDQFTRVMIKYGVTHRLATAYHPQTSGQVEVFNRGLKRILERTVGENRASWSDKLDDALWAFCTAYKTLIGCTSYKLVYGKSCHLPIELEHRVYWALKHVNFDIKTTGERKTRKGQNRIKTGQKWEASSSKLSRDQTSSPTSYTNPTPKGRIRKSSKQKVENFNFEEHIPPVATMVDNRTMAEMLRAPTEGCAEAIVVPPILAEQFELKRSLINMMTSNQFFGLENDNPHDHIRWDSPLVARKRTPRSITTWDDLVLKFISEFFPPSRTTNLRNEILNFHQKFDESFHEVWERYKDLIHACPHHGSTELHRLDTFYNALNPAEQDSLNAAAGGNLLERSTQDVLTIIENKSKVRNSQSKPIASQVKACDTTSSSEIAKLTHAVNQQTNDVTTAMTAMLKQLQATPPPSPVMAVEETCVTCGGAHPYYQCLAAGGNTFPEFRDNIQGYVPAAASNYNQGNPGYRPQGVANQMRPQEQPYQATTQSNQNFHLDELEKIKRMNDVSMKAMQNQIDMVKNELRNEMKTSIQTYLSNQTNEIKNMMASLLQMNIAFTSGSGSLLSNNVANPKGELKAITTRSGLVNDGPTVPTPPKFITPEEDERVEETYIDLDLAEYTIKVPPPPVQKHKPPFQRNFVVHIRDSPIPNILYPSRMLKQKQQDKDEIQIQKFWHMFKQLHLNITLAEALVLMPKYQKMPKALLYNKEKLQELANTPLNENCSAVILKKSPKKLGDPGKFLIPCGFSLPDLIPTRMTLELANREIYTPDGIARDVFVPVGKFTFPADFVVVDYESDPRVPLILGRPFLRTARALIDIHGEEMILCDGDERLTLNMKHDTASYSNHPHRESVNLINIFNVSSEDCLEVLVLNQQSGNPTFSLHQKITSPEVTHEIHDSEGCNFLSEELLNIDSFNDIHPYFDDNPLSKDSDLKDSIDQTDLANLDDYFVDPTPKMFTDEHALDYSFPSRFDVYDDDFLEIESDADNVYNDPFESNGEKIKESKLLMDELDLPCDSLPYSESGSFNSQDFSKDDDLPSSSIEDKVFNTGILIQEKSVTIITRVAREKKLAIALASLVFEEFDPPFYEPLVFKDVHNLIMLLPFSFKNEEKVFKPGIYTSEKVKERQEKDKIGSKPEKNGKRGEAWKSRRPITTRVSDHRKLQLNELSELHDQAYENSVIYKERTKKLHDSKIKNRIFSVGDQVLLFNSRLKIFSGKLKTRWSGPFTITRVYPYGTIELSQPNGSNFKVNGHRVKHYFGGDIPSNVAPDLHTFPMDN
uniref:DNA-directed DNA polymerase n=1 Tax=Tanacetum cinerariifolium TaxID=118510 RepID=A0A6L2MHE0_TANCI|nr:DNA-directed DNA polymerase [Tanacetum cinerariifolium]